MRAATLRRDHPRAAAIERQPTSGAAPASASGAPTGGGREGPGSCERSACRSGTAAGLAPLRTGIGHLMEVGSLPARLFGALAQRAASQTGTEPSGPESGRVIGAQPRPLAFGQGQERTRAEASQLFGAGARNPRRAPAAVFGPKRARETEGRTRGEQGTSSDAASAPRRRDLHGPRSWAPAIDPMEPSPREHRAELGGNTE